MVGNMTRFGEYKERILNSGEQKYKWKQRFGRPKRRRKNIQNLISKIPKEKSGMVQQGGNSAT
jgi:hypothetical protein